MVLMITIVHWRSKVQQVLSHPDGWPALELFMIDCNSFVIFVVLGQPNEGIVYFTGSNRKVVAQLVDILGGFSHPNDANNVGQIRRGKRKDIEQLCCILGKKNDVTLQTEM
jgi:hypothetical protein